MKCWVESSNPTSFMPEQKLVRLFAELDKGLAKKTHPLGDRESVFVGQIGAGEIYNQAPTEFRLSGMRRWLPGTDVARVEEEYRALLNKVEQRDGIEVDGRFLFLGEAFELDREHRLVRAFQSAARAVMGKPLAMGSKRFLDDGNIFMERAGITAITHGPDAKGPHTVNEQVAVDELQRVALVYALNRCPILWRRLGMRCPRAAIPEWGISGVYVGSVGDRVRDGIPLTSSSL